MHSFPGVRGPGCFTGIEIKGQSVPSDAGANVYTYGGVSGTGPTCVAMCHGKGRAASALVAAACSFMLW